MAGWVLSNCVVSGWSLVRESGGEGQSESRMREIRTSGLMSGDGKRGDALRQHSRPSSTLPVPTVTFRLLYGFFVIEHGRRKILHINVTRHPTADWVVQQLREAFPEAGAHRYVILDRDSKFDAEVIAFLKATGLQPKRTGIQAPWQNGTAERWVGSCRREILDHVIPLNEQHLRRLIRDYVNYHHEHRVHDSLDKDTPNHRPVEQKPAANAVVISHPRLGGLHHRYAWREAAVDRLPGRLPRGATSRNGSVRAKAHGSRAGSAPVPCSRLLRRTCIDRSSLPGAR